VAAATRLKLPWAREGGERELDTYLGEFILIG